MTIEMVTEQIKEVVSTFGEQNVPVLIIWDSLASTATAQELKPDFNPNQLGVKAKAISNMTIQIGQSINQSNTAFVILNQARDDMSNPMFPTIKSTGGRALEHWGSLRLEVKKASQLKEKVEDPMTGKESDEYVGHIFRAITKKSKVSTPNRKAEMYLISMPYKGLDFVENVYRAATEQYKLIKKSAGWRNYTTDDGKDIKLYDRDWVPFLESEEGQPVLEELFMKEHTTFFPDGYAPLKNENIDVKNLVYYKQLEQHYKDKEKQEKEEAKKEKEKEKEESKDKEEETTE